MKVLLFLFVLVSTPLLAQVKLPSNELGQVQYQEIVRLPDSKRPSRQIITQARAWLETQYPNEGDAEQQYDQEHAILFIKSAYRINEQDIRYTLTIEGKFGRYRATITDLVAESDGFASPILSTSPSAAELSRVADNKAKNSDVINQTVKQQEDLYRKLDRQCRLTLNSLKEYLVSQADNQTK
ncbi:hypothetical protein WBJ53_04630 [Spirosoma sp. SC4-14]|uniref:hypothetical protein n=1 Tax=Spirosoma sp. SC4-14 TaxID=3128900 RepID=UPI0030CB7399